MAEIVKQPERTMILRVHLGEGETEGEPFNFGYSNKGLVWYFEEERRYYTISYQELIEDVLKFREDNK